MSPLPRTLALTDREVDLATGAVTGASEVQRLTTRELALVRHLAGRPGEVVSRDALMTEVWGYADTVLSRACDSALSRLRAKLERDPAHPVHLLTVFGEGYRFVPRGDPGTNEPVEASIAAPPLRLGAVRLDLDRHRAHTPSGDQQLSAGEVAILRKLAAARGGVVGRAALGSGRALDNAVRRIRQKLEPDPDAPRYLLTVRGGGYRLDVAEAPREPAVALLGRDGLVGEVTAALERARWVVLTGPGGMGKTRLAQRVLASRNDALWVDLAPARSAVEVLIAMATALDVEPGSDPESTVTAALTAAGTGLVVLDNLEGLVDPIADRIARWLEAAPGLRLLGTSRVRLGLDGEHAIEVGPLAEADAVRLFLDRARASAWVPRPGDLAAVRELVTRLDGLPLAIELAAARAGVLGPQGLVDRLDRRLDLLARPRAGVSRHRSLRDVLEGSWDLLAEPDRGALLALSLFPAGFSVDDAERLLGPGGLDAVQALRDHSLIHARDVGSFGIYESIRAFAAERRGELPDGGRAVETAWARWLARLGRPEHLARLGRRGEEARTAGQRARVDALEVAADLAIHWGEAEVAALATLGAGAVRAHRGPFVPTLDRIARIDAPAALAGRLRALQGELLRRMDRPDEAIDVLDRALAAGPDIGDAGRLRAIRSSASSDLARYAEAADDARDAATALEAEEPDLAAMLAARGATYAVYAGRAVDPALALAAWERAARVAGSAGNPLLEGEALHQLARFDQANGRPRLAWDRYRAAAERFAALDAPSHEAAVLRNLLILLMNLGEVEEHARVVARAHALTARTQSAVEEATLAAYEVAACVVWRDPPGARAAAARARSAVARSRPVPRTEGYLELREAELMLHEQDPRSAEALARTARARFVALGDAHNVRRADAVLALCLIPDGRIDEALALADDALTGMRADDPDGYGLAITQAARGRVRLARGDRPGAEADLAEGTAIAARLGLLRPRSESAVALDRLRAALESPTP